MTEQGRLWGSTARGMVIDEWRPRRTNTLRGFVRVNCPSNLVLGELAVHRGADGCWLSMPAKPMLDANGVAMRDERGKIRYAAPLISFTTRAARDRFAQQVLQALHEQYPGALDDVADAGEVEDTPSDEVPPLTGGLQW